MDALCSCGNGARSVRRRAWQDAPRVLPGFPCRVDRGPQVCRVRDARCRSRCSPSVSVPLKKRHSVRFGFWFGFYRIRDCRRGQGGQETYTIVLEYYSIRAFPKMSFFGSKPSQTALFAPLNLYQFSELLYHFSELLYQFSELLYHFSELLKLVYYVN